MENKKEHIKNIYENYISLENKILLELKMLEKHPTISGSHREKIWSDLFEQIIPKKYKIGRNIFVMDSNGNISKEVDIAIYDENYTPYIFKYGELKYIPIESVVAVIECKSKGKGVAELEAWCNSINNLKTSDKGIARMQHDIVKAGGDTQKGTKPIKIYATPFNKSIGEKKTSRDKMFDIVIQNEEKNNDSQGKLKITYRIGGNTIGDIATELNVMEDEKKDKIRKNHKENIEEIFKTDNTLITFLLTFNQMLMLINNPMLFPHKAYAEIFKKYGGK